MKPGPKKKVISIVEGSWNNSEHDMNNSEHDMPCYVKGKAVAIWQQLMLQLRQTSILSDVDTHVIARYCVMLARWIEITEIINEEGMFYRSGDSKKKKKEPDLFDQEHDQEQEERKGLIKKHPATSHEREVLQELNRLESKLGLSPGDRVSLNIENCEFPSNEEKQKSTTEENKEYFGFGMCS